MQNINSENYKTAIFAGGCFWCMVSPFDVLDGIISVTSGYTGGELKSPTYKDVKSQGTGHEWLTWKRCLNEFIPNLFKN